MLEVKLRGDNFELEMKKKVHNQLMQRDCLEQRKSLQDPVAIDSRLEDVVNRMFARCLEDRVPTKAPP